MAIAGQHFVDPRGTADNPPVPHLAPPGRGLAIASLVVGLTAAALAWLPFVFVVGAIAAVVACALAIAALVRERRSPHPAAQRLARWGLTSGVAALMLGVLGYFFTLTMIDRLDEWLGLGRYDATVVSCTAAGRVVSIDGTVQNLDDHTHDYEVRVDVLDGDALAATDRATVRDVISDGTGTFHLTVFTDSALTAPQCRVAAVSAPGF